MTSYRELRTIIKNVFFCDAIIYFHLFNYIKHLNYKLYSTSKISSITVIDRIIMIVCKTKGNF